MNIEFNDFRVGQRVMCRGIYHGIKAKIISIIPKGDVVGTEFKRLKLKSLDGVHVFETDEWNVSPTH